MRAPILALLPLALSCVSIDAVGALPPSPARPNVLIIVPDDIGFADFSFYNPNGPRTPNIDGLARQSVRLTDFHVSPTCSPSRASLMTGRYNNATGVWHTILGRYFLRSDEVTMAEVFKANGYRTALFGKWHLGDNHPFRPKDRGFEHVAMIRGGGIDQVHNPWGNTNNSPSTLLVDDRPVPLAPVNDDMPGAFSTNFFTDCAIDYIQKQAAGRAPFFAYLPYNAVHQPHDFPPDARPGISAQMATTENLDKNIGRLLRCLDEAALTDNTLIVFFTDNGMANAMLRGGKGSHYDGGHRVPCFIRWKHGGIGGSHATSGELDRLTGHIDLLPTLMELLGLHDVADRPANVPIQGASIATLLDRNPANDDPILATRAVCVDNQRLDHLVKYRQACVMKDEIGASGRMLHKWRMVRISERQAWSLHDVAADPKEQVDLADRPELVPVLNHLRASYESWWNLVSARRGEYCRAIIGSPAQTLTCLHSDDWHTDGDVPWTHGHVAAGLKGNGFNAVEFAHAGDYSFDLRRWPQEIEDETTLTSALSRPIVHGKGDRPTLGVVLPIRSARIRIWNAETVYADERQAVVPDSDGAVFTVRSIPAGPALVQTWFFDVNGNELCGSYYVYVAPPP